MVALSLHSLILHLSILPPSILPNSSCLAVSPPPPSGSLHPRSSTARHFSPPQLGAPPSLMRCVIMRSKLLHYPHIPRIPFSIPCVMLTIAQTQSSCGFGLLSHGDPMVFWCGCRTTLNTLRARACVLPQGLLDPSERYHKTETPFLPMTWLFPERRTALDYSRKSFLPTQPICTNHRHPDGLPLRRTHDNTNRPVKLEG